MATALRVFISSTMKDLANERAEVVRKLRAFSMEPVNAEGWLPDGSGSWDRIAEELAASDLFVLLLGDKYGWIPDRGPGAGPGLSATELEYVEARKQGIPVLPFVKNLSYDAERETDDAKKRDEFREKVSAWEDGQLIAKFDLAFDLAEKVGQSLIQVITREYLKVRVRQRLADKKPPARTRDAGGDRLPVIPPELVQDLHARRAVLFAGAGMSLAAGLPTAAAFAEYLRESIRAIAPDYLDAAHSFASAAADLEAVASREVLVARVRDMLHPPQGLNHTFAHEAALRFFDQIFTTNWDSLFEEALRSTADDRPTIATEVDAPLPPRMLMKLHGSLDEVASLIITEADVALIDESRATVWAETQRILREKTVVVVGMSLRDPSIIELLEEAAQVHRGYFVAPEIDAATRARVGRWGFECIAATADTFFAALSLTLVQGRRDR